MDLTIPDNILIVFVFLFTHFQSCKPSPQVFYTFALDMKTIIIIFFTFVGKYAQLINYDVPLLPISFVLGFFINDSMNINNVSHEFFIIKF